MGGNIYNELINNIESTIMDLDDISSSTKLKYNKIILNYFGHEYYNKIINNAYLSLMEINREYNTTTMIYNCFINNLDSELTKNPDLHGYLYVIRTTHCKKYIPNGGEVFKCGFTEDIFHRLYMYGNDTELLLCLKFNNKIKLLETELLNKLSTNELCDREKIFGNEYYSGNTLIPCNLILDLMSEYKLLDSYTFSEINKIISLDNQTDVYSKCLYNPIIHEIGKEYFYIISLRLPKSNNSIYKYGFTRNLYQNIIREHLCVDIIFVLNIEVNLNIIKTELINRITTFYKDNCINNEYIICNISDIFEIIKCVINENNIFCNPISNGLWHNNRINNILTYVKKYNIYYNYNIIRPLILSNKSNVLVESKKYGVSPEILIWLLFYVKPRALVTSCHHVKKK